MPEPWTERDKRLFRAQQRFNMRVSDAVRRLQAGQGTAADLRVMAGLRAYTLKQQQHLNPGYTRLAERLDWESRPERLTSFLGYLQGQLPLKGSGDVVNPGGFLWNLQRIAMGAMEGTDAAAGPGRIAANVPALDGTAPTLTGQIRRSRPALPAVPKPPDESPAARLTRVLEELAQPDFEAQTIDAALQALPEGGEGAAENWQDRYRQFQHDKERFNELIRTMKQAEGTADYDQLVPYLQEAVTIARRYDTSVTPTDLISSQGRPYAERLGWIRKRMLDSDVGRSLEQAAKIARQNMDTLSESLQEMMFEIESRAVSERTRFTEPAQESIAAAYQAAIAKLVPTPGELSGKSAAEQAAELERARRDVLAFLDRIPDVSGLREVREALKEQVQAVDKEGRYRNDIVDLVHGRNAQLQVPHLTQFIKDTLNEYNHLPEDANWQADTAEERIARSIITDRVHREAYLQLATERALKRDEGFLAALSDVTADGQLRALLQSNSPDAQAVTERAVALVHALAEKPEGKKTQAERQVLGRLRRYMPGATAQQKRYIYSAVMGGLSRLSPTEQPEAYLMELAQARGYANQTLFHELEYVARQMLTDANPTGGLPTQEQVRQKALELFRQLRRAERQDRKQPLPVDAAAISRAEAQLGRERSRFQRVKANYEAAYGSLKDQLAQQIQNAEAALNDAQAALRAVRREGPAADRERLAAAKQTVAERQKALDVLRAKAERIHTLPEVAPLRRELIAAQEAMQSAEAALAGARQPSRLRQLIRQLGLGERVQAAHLEAERRVAEAIEQGALLHTRGELIRPLKLTRDPVTGRSIVAYRRAGDDITRLGVRLSAKQWESLFQRPDQTAEAGAILERIRGLTVPALPSSHFHLGRPAANAAAVMVSEAARPRATQEAWNTWLIEEADRLVRIWGSWLTGESQSKDPFIRNAKGLITGFQRTLDERYHEARNAAVISILEKSGPALRGAQSKEEFRQIVEGRWREIFGGLFDYLDSAGGLSFAGDYTKIQVQTAERALSAFKAAGGELSQAEVREIFRHVQNRPEYRPLQSLSYAQFETLLLRIQQLSNPLSFQQFSSDWLPGEERRRQEAAQLERDVATSIADVLDAGDTTIAEVTERVAREQQAASLDEEARLRRIRQIRRAFQNRVEGAVGVRLTEGEAVADLLTFGYGRIDQRTGLRQNRATLTQLLDAAVQDARIMKGIDEYLQAQASIDVATAYALASGAVRHKELQERAARYLSEKATIPLVGPRAARLPLSQQIRIALENATFWVQTLGKDARFVGPRLPAGGAPGRILKDNTFKVGPLTAYGAEMAEYTFRAYADELGLEARPQHGYEVTSSDVRRGIRRSETGEALELPIVALKRPLDLVSLMGGYVGEKLDPHATFINLRTVMSGQADAVWLDTEYLPFLEDPELRGAFQLLQVAWRRMSVVNGEIRFSEPEHYFIRPNQELLDLLERYLGSRSPGGEPGVYARLAAEGADLRQLTQIAAGAPELSPASHQRLLEGLQFLGYLSARNQAEHEAVSAMFVRAGGQITGIRDLDMIRTQVWRTVRLMEEGKTVKEAVRERLMADLTPNTVLIGSNPARAELKVLSEALGEPVQRRTVDLTILARYFWPQGMGGQPSWGQQAWAQALPEGSELRVLYESSPHNALTDIVFASRYFSEVMLPEMERQGINPAEIPLARVGSFVAIPTDYNRLGLKPGVWAITGASSGPRKDGSYRLYLEGVSGDIAGQRELIERPTRTEIMEALTQYGHFSLFTDEAGREAALREAQSYYTEVHGLRQSELLSRGFENLWYMENLLDAGAGGARSKQVETFLNQIGSAQDATKPEDLAELLANGGTTPQAAAIAAQLKQNQFPTDQPLGVQLTLAGREELRQHLEYLRDHGLSVDMRQAGAVMAAMADTEGFQVIRDAQIRVQAAAQAARTIGYEDAETESRKLLRQLNDIVKSLAPVRQSERLMQLPPLPTQRGPVPLFFDRTASHSMWDNVNAIMAAMGSGGMDTAAQRQAALRTLRAHLVSHGIIQPLPDEAVTASIDLIWNQIAEGVQSGRVQLTPVTYSDYSALPDVFRAMTPEQTAALRQQVSSILNDAELMRAVTGDPRSRLQLDLQYRAMRELADSGQYIPLPRRLTLPMTSEQTVLWGPGGFFSEPRTLVAQAEELAARYQALSTKLAGMRHGPWSEVREYLTAQQRTVRTELGEVLGLIRQQLPEFGGDAALAQELAALVGNPAAAGPVTAEEAARTMILFAPTPGGWNLAGRRLGDLSAAERKQLEDALHNMRRSFMPEDAPLRQVLTDRLRLLNQGLEAKAASAAESGWEALGMARPNLVGARAAAEIADEVAQQVAEAAGSMAQEAIHRTAAGSGSDAAAEYILERLYRGVSRHMTPGFVLGAMGGAALLGAVTLGGRTGPERRPVANDAPAPDGTYDDDLAERPLPPDISMGRQVYLEPNGSGLTVKLRTRSHHSGQSMASMVQAALGMPAGQLTVNVRDNTATLDQQWLQQQFATLL